MGHHKPILIAYDISKNKTRSRVLKIVREWRLGGQKSVHECKLDSKQAEELFLQLSHAIDQATDLLLMAWIEPNRKMLCKGMAQNRLEQKLRHIF